MCAKISQDGKKGKELILEAAFSFYDKPHYEDFSMNQLAAKVGVTKPALYRHFKNKDAVIAGMKEHFYSLLAERIKEIQSKYLCTNREETASLICDLIDFFADNTSYINYFINQFNDDLNFDETLKNELLSRGCRNDLFKNLKDNDRIKTYSHVFYCGASVLFFIKVREEFLKNSSKKGTKDFSATLMSFLVKGFAGTVSEKSVLYPVKMSAERMEELDGICQADDSVLPPEDRVFTAFAEVIKKYGIAGVTVERIASELNMAKSSLYFYFENKNQMIISLIEKEIALLLAMINENITEAKNYSEYVYITMRTEAAFFLKRKSTLLLCGWMMQNTVESPFSARPECGEINNIWEKKLGSPVKDFNPGFEILPEHLTAWIGVITVGVMVMGMKHGAEENQILEGVKNIYDFVLNGVAIIKK